MARENSNLKSVLKVFIAGVLVFSVSMFFNINPAFASDDWKGQIVPYVWLISLDGETSEKGIDVEIDAGFDDIIDEINFVMMLEYEIQKGSWGFWGNTIYGNIGDSNIKGPLGLTNIKPTVKILLQGIGGFYRVGTWDIGDSTQAFKPRLTTDIYSGVRYTNLDVELDFNGTFSGIVSHASESVDWWDPLIGIRTIWDIAPNWVLTLSGDIGGLGVASDSWQAYGVLGYRFKMFGKNDAVFAFGYRALSQEYSDGGGNSRFAWDTKIHGPVLGLVIKF